MSTQKEEYEYQIMTKAVQMELDYILYVDVRTKECHTITMNGERGRLPIEDGDYDEMLAAEIAANIHPDDRARCEEALQLPNLMHELSRQPYHTLQYRIVVGEALLHKETKVYYQDDAKQTIVFVRRDITQSYRAQELARVRLYQAMLETKRANTAKSEFLIRMSHEIRTPMNSIIGLTYLSRENIGNSSQVLNNLDKIESSANFLRSFVDDILNLSQIESGNIALHELDTDFVDFLNRMTAKVREDAMQKGVQFLAENRGAFSKKYHFDEDKLGEALSNVLQNAVRYTKEEGQIVFITELLSETEEGAKVRFEVRDNGIGMEKEFLPHVFEPFAQEDKKSITLYGGTGLGLSITKNIVEMMGGKIDVYSEKGSGTTFVITVTLASAEGANRGANTVAGAFEDEYDFTGKRVLLVEDNEINVEITRHILEHKKFQVEVAFDGREAVDAFLGHDEGYFDAILMDIRMPNMDGLDATREIRKSDHPDHAKVPIIAMTANAFEEDVRKSLEAGMDAHLSKPVDIRQMSQTLERLIYGGQREN